MISDVIIPVVHPLYMVTPQNARRFYKVLLMTCNRVINSSKFKYAILIHLLVATVQAPVELHPLLTVHLGACSARVRLVARL